MFFYLWEMDQTILNIQSLRENIKKELHGLYPEREINSLFEILVDDRLGFKGHEIGLNRLMELDNNDVEWFREAISRMRDFYPVQYITGSTEFLGIPLKIKPGVLIPRPETEELVEWIRIENQLENPRILDVGTGSGCIAIALKKLLPGSEITATDISAKALAIAGENANSLDLQIFFREHDIKTGQALPDLQGFDIIVSNPPYIPESEKSGMDRNVADFEPFEALFVPDRDPLIFYRLIAEFSRENLNVGGLIYFELHEHLAEQVSDMLLKNGLTDISVRRDINGKSRMLKCSKNEV